MILLVAQRVVNILVPYQLGVVVGELAKQHFSLPTIFLYVFFLLLQGQQGLIGSLRAIIWIPIGQSAHQRLTLATYEHVMNLSLEFHLSKRVGEVLSALNKGNSINTFLEGLLFTLLPMVFDLWVAAAFFIVEFETIYAVVVIAVTWLYLYVTMYMAKHRGRVRREATARDREIEAAKWA